MHLFLGYATNYSSTPLLQENLPCAAAYMSILRKVDLCHPRVWVEE